jgi:serine/threonine protein kinase
MKAYLQNNAVINLSQSDFLASGGEGSVYKKANQAFKIYQDSSKMIPLGKLNELAILAKPTIISPKEALFDEHKKPIGYVMPLAPRSNPLCRLFTKAFKDANNVSNDKILDLVLKFRNDVKYIHEKGILIVDCNELNFLVDDQFENIYFIDVDSYQTAHYRATALMDSIKDWQANGVWTDGSDWFSWGVLAFQMITGIHPYKGKHPSMSSLQNRMQKSISVFNKDVKVPKIVPDFKIIPDALRVWFKAVFDDQKRECPPDWVNGTYVIVSPSNVVISSAVLNITEVDCFKEDIIMMLDYCERVFVTKKSGYKNSKIPCDIPIVKNGYFYKGKHYELNGQSLVLRQEIGHNKIITDKIVANVMPNSSIAYDGVVIQNMLGTYYATFCPAASESYSVKISEIDSKSKIVDAKFDSSVLMVMTVKDGKYNKYTLRFYENFNTYSCWTDLDVDYYSLNFAVLDTGVCAEINENEELVLFASKPIGGKKTIKDSQLSHGMKLFADKNNLMFYQGDKIFSMKMK